MATAREDPRAAVAVVGAISRSVGAKLFTLLFVVLLLNLSILGWANVRLHRQHLELETRRAAERLNDVIARSIGYTMLRNDREALRQVVESVSQEPDILTVRIFSHTGSVAFSSLRREVGTSISRDTQECAGCHGPHETSSVLNGAGRFRIFPTRGQRSLSIMTPIANAPGCWSAACHAHAPNQRILGLLQTTISLAAADSSLRRSTIQFAAASAVAIVLALLASGVFVWRFVHQPVTTLRYGTECLAHGELGFQIPVISGDELGTLARSFNDMSRQLLEARSESSRWATTLEKRVEEKSAELHLAHRQMLQAEKLTSLGKLAAVVAHEINNPLSGILTYARLLRKWVERGDSLESRGAEMRDALQLIESESRRCGDIVQSLLAFARVAPLNIERVDLGELARRTIKLVEHKLDLGGINYELQLDRNLPLIQGDAAQLEQLILALVMNAIDAMPHDGNLRLITRPKGDAAVELLVCDNGVGIPEDIKPHLFEPFVTTKESGKGVGLGLAVSRSVIERHHGRISVESELGRGTTFTIELPIGPSTTTNDAGEAQEKESWNKKAEFSSSTMS